MKKTNFFETLSSLGVEGDWNLNIKAAGGRMLVSVLFTSDKTGDAARKLIPPIILKGTASELDEGFFPSIQTPVQKTAALFVNMEAYEKAQEQARLQSRMESDKKTQEAKEKTEGEKRFRSAMKKAAELEEVGKFREAYAQLPKPADHPGFETEISHRKEALSAKFETGGLFENQSTI